MAMSADETQDLRDPQVRSQARWGETALLDAHRVIAQISGGWPGSDGIDVAGLKGFQSQFGPV